MKLSEMTTDERLTLGSLVRLVVGADGTLSADEASDLQRLAEEVGETEFWSLVRTTQGESYTPDAVQARARTVRRRQAQQQIYNIVFTIASEGSIMDGEDRLLGWLEKTWDIDSRDLTDRLEPSEQPVSDLERPSRAQTVR